MDMQADGRTDIATFWSCLPQLIITKSQLIRREDFPEASLVCVEITFGCSYFLFYILPEEKGPDKHNKYLNDEWRNKFEL